MENLNNEPINNEPELTEQEETTLDDSDFRPSYRMRLLKPIEGKRDLIREIGRRTGYTHRSLKVILDTISDIMEDAVYQEYDIVVPDIFVLKYHTIKPYRGVNAYKTRMNPTKEIIYEDYPEGRRVVFHLSLKLRKLAKEIYDKKRKKENSDE